MFKTLLFTVCSLVFIPACPTFAQEAENSGKSQPDELIFTNGERLLGQLERSNGSSVTFKSDMAGEVTVEWSKIKELHSSQKFAVIQKDVKLGRRPDPSQIPQGTISMTDQKIAVNGPSGSQSIPVAQAQILIDQPTFEGDVVNSPKLYQDWRGGITAGASLVEATQVSRTYTGAVNLVRSVPGESWLDPRNRTIIDFTAAYGKVTQPRTPSVKTEIFHADAERDEYFSPRVYVFGQIAYDHNFSQGLDLEQTYGGGIGVTVVKRTNEELDLRGSANYIKQEFSESSQNTNLFGSIFSEIYNRKLPGGLLLVESLSVTPSWNILADYSALGNIGLTLPVYKHFNLSFNALDNFLNNPPPGFKKNSFQFTAGLTYTLP